MAESKLSDGEVSMPKCVKLFFILMLLLFIPSGCYKGDSKSLSQIIPDGSIVFLPYPRRNDKIGYFASTTLEPRFLKISDSLVKIKWLPEYQFFIGLSWYRHLIAARIPSIWGPYPKDYTKLTSKESLADMYSIFIFRDNEKQIFLGNSTTIWLIDFITEKILLTLPEPIYDQVYEYNEISYDTVSNCLFAEIRSNEFKLTPMDSIQKYCFDKGDWEFVTLGRNPQISPDGSMLAFTKDDGLYMIDFADNSEINVFSGDFSNQYLFSPHPQWSSDGNKIVFHYWSVSPGSDRANLAKIYLLDLVSNISLDTGIIGLYPSFKD